jgi:hypothetical protein
LPDNHSCGAFCADFPRCLPSLPATVAVDLNELQEQLTTDHEALRERLALLDQLQEAITQGIERKGDDAQA